MPRPGPNRRRTVTLSAMVRISNRQGEEGSAPPHRGLACGLIRWQQPHMRPLRPLDAAGEARRSGRRRAAGLRAASMADPKELDHASPCLPAVAALLPCSGFLCTPLRAALAKRAPMRALCGRRGECPGGCHGAVRLTIGGCVIVGEGRRRRCFPRSGERKKDRGGTIQLESA